MSFTTLELAALVLAVEFALLAWIGPILVLRRGNKLQHADVAEAGELLDEVEKQEPARRDALSTIFATTYQLEGEELDSTVAEFVAREQAFYRVMTSVYLERRPERLKEIPEELTKVISPWIRMTPDNMVDAASLGELESENSALQSELETTKSDMEALMAEYLAAFEKAKTLAADAEAAEAEAGDSAVQDGPSDAPDTPVETAPEATASEADAQPAPAADEAATPDEGAEPIAAGDEAVAETDEVPAEAAAQDADDDSQGPVFDIGADDDEAELGAADAPANEAASAAFDVSVDQPDEEFDQDDIDALFALNDDEEEDQPAAA